MVRHKACSGTPQSVQWSTTRPVVRVSAVATRVKVISRSTAAEHLSFISSRSNFRGRVKILFYSSNRRLVTGYQVFFIPAGPVRHFLQGRIPYQDPCPLVLPPLYTHICRAPRREPPTHRSDLGSIGAVRA